MASPCTNFSRVLKMSFIAAATVFNFFYFKLMYILHLTIIPLYFMVSQS